MEPLDYNNVPGCTYCFPEIASVGYTEEKLLKRDMRLKLVNFHLQHLEKPKLRHTDGFVKVIFDAKYGEWLGCHMIGLELPT